MTPSKIRIGTRGSPLALYQANRVVDMLIKHDATIRCELVQIQTSGDRFQGERLANAGGKGLFVKEIETALLNGEIDCAVHSLKDVPGALVDDFKLVAFLPREDSRDVLVSRERVLLSALPAQARIGTSSPRREVQLRLKNAQWQLLPIRGNVETRLNKLKNGYYDAIVLAAAGLHRLQLQSEITEYLDCTTMIPALGQGVIAIEIKKENQTLSDLFQQACNDKQTAICAIAERAFLKQMEGDCVTPLAGYARLENDQLILTGWLSNLQGTKVIQEEMKSNDADAAKCGKALAEKIKELGGKTIMEEMQCTT